MMRRPAALVALSLCLLGCPDRGSKSDGGTITKPTASDVRWTVPDSGTLRYDVEFRRAASLGSVTLPLTETFELSFGTAGEVDIRKNGDAVGSYRMDERGGLVKQPGSPLPPPSLAFLAIAGEAMTGDLEPGRTWERLDPSAAEVAASTDDVILQARREYTVRSVQAGGELVIDFLGYTRFIDTPRARALLVKLFPGIDAAGTAADGVGALLDDWTVLTKEHLYLSGTLVFDLARHHVVSANAVLILAREAGMSPATLATRDDRIEMTFTLK